MSTSITTFFDQFAHDFAAFDGELIASRYSDPYLSVSAAGKMQCHIGRQAIAGYFQALLNGYKRQGVRGCRYTDLTTTAVGEQCQLAILEWELLDDHDQVVVRWRESYNLINGAQGWRIYASADFSSP